MLKRFHTFQQIVFQAEDFELEFIASQSRPRARIIGHTAFQVILKKLNQLLHDQSISDHHYKLLKLFIFWLTVLVCVLTKYSGYV